MFLIDVQGNKGLSLPNAFGKLLTILCSAAFSCTLYGQTDSFLFSGGTVLAFTVDEGRIVVATDSREFKRFDPEKKFNDHSCKITPLGERMFFSATGSVEQAEKKRGVFVYTYKAHESAKLAFQRFQRGRNTALRERQIATYWGNEMRRKIQDIFARRPKQWPGDSDTVLTGVFGGATGTAEFSFYIVKIEFHTSKSNPDAKVVTSVVTAWTPAQGQSLNWRVLGSPDIVGVDEFLQGQTPRARAAINRARDTIKVNSGIDVTAFLIETAIISAEDWAVHKYEVGGPVDILEVTNKGLHWIKVKDECR